MEKQDLHRNHNQWQGIKILLREKLKQSPNTSPSNNTPEAYWHRLEELTGVSKEEFKMSCK